MINIQTLRQLPMNPLNDNIVDLAPEEDIDMNQRQVTPVVTNLDRQRATTLLHNHCRSAQIPPAFWETDLLEFGEAGELLIEKIDRYFKRQGDFENYFIYNPDHNIAYPVIRNFRLRGTTSSYVMTMDGLLNLYRYYKNEVLEPFPYLTDKYYETMLNGGGPDVLFMEGLIDRAVDSIYDIDMRDRGAGFFYFAIGFIKDRLQNPDLITLISSYSPQSSIADYYGHALQKIVNETMIEL